MAGTFASSTEELVADQKRDDVTVNTIELQPTQNGLSAASATQNPRYKTLPSAAHPLQEEDETWLWEIAGCVVSVIALALIVLVLVISDDKPLPRLPWKIKLGSVLSVLVVFLEGGASLAFASCMCQIMWIRFRMKHCSLTDIDLYEGASRGIWGSVKLLCSGRAGFKGLMGILVCAMLLATSPFTQNTLGSRQTKGNASIRRCIENSASMSSTLYGSFASSLMSGDWVSSGSQLGVDAALQGLNTDCPSGNCDFPTYNSLGICSQCDDYTKSVKSSCAFQYSNMDDTTDFVCNRTLNIAGTFLEINNYTINDFDLGNNSIAQWHDPIFMDIEIGSNTGSGTPTARYSYTNSQTGGGGGPLIGSGFAILRNLADNNAEYEASYCSLYYCVRAYNTTVRNFTLSQDVVESWYPTHPGKDEFADDNDNTFMSPLVAAWPSLNITSPVNFTIWSGETWDYDVAFDPDIVNWIDDALTGKYKFIANSAQSGSGNFTTGTGGAFLEAIYNNLANKPHGTVDSLFKFVTERMTNTWRATCPKDIAAIGTVNDLETVVNVEWAWLGLPAAVVLFSCVLLAIVISECRREDINLWKNYALPKLYYGVAPELHHAFDSGVDDFNRMKKKVKDVKVKLERNGDGDWWFVAAGKEA